MRTESDFLGEVSLPEDALYGIHAWRARENFPDHTPFPVEWYKAAGKTKLACYLTYANFKQAVHRHYPDKESFLNLVEDRVLEALISAARETATGSHFEWFIVPAIQGGAGTSINMNINEILANVSLLKLGNRPGDYHVVDPIEQANLFQSTNDVIPTSLKVCLMELLESLEKDINALRFQVEKTEQRSKHALRIGYTQMQPALPSTYGMLFSTYGEALSRDWWRVSKCFERIKTVNLGGGAMGTGMSIPRFFIMEVVPMLQRITNLPLTRSENLPDATNNLDSLVEVHGILKAHAVNLEKMVHDIRLLSSGLLGKNELAIPQKQTGSSIMPGKVNPVIPEFVISAVHKVYANDMLVSGLCGQGCLDLNPYLPGIGVALIDSIKLLAAANQTLQKNLMEGLVIQEEEAASKLYYSPSITTALNPFIGYKRAAELAGEMKTSGESIFEVNGRLQLLDNERLSRILKPENLVKMGFSLRDL